MTIPDRLVHPAPAPPAAAPRADLLGRRGALWRRVSTAQRLLVVAPVGVVVGVATGLFAPWAVAVIAAWDALAAILVAWTWFAVAPLDARETEAVATREDNHRVATELLLLSASVVSLVGTAFDFLRAGNEHGTVKAVLVALGIATVAASWALVHTIFTLRYAREYYTTPVGGIGFNSDDPPAYGDFAYVAFTVGMTFQVSDTDIDSRTIRRTVLHHSLLAYLFGAVIVASMVNLVANIAR